MTPIITTTFALIHAFTAFCDPAGGGIGTDGNSSYCTTTCPCDDGHGDCDSDSQCKSGLCAQGVGPAFGLGPDVDVCVPAGLDCDSDPCGNPACGATSCGCDLVGGGEGTPGSYTYCSALCTCDDTFGDCDRDSHCKSGLCAQDVGAAYGFSPTIDVCVATGFDCDSDPCGSPECGATHCLCDDVGGGNGTPYAGQYCTVYCPCSDGFGDCNQDSECQSGLCAQNVGAAFGRSAALDLCLPAGLDCEINPCGNPACGATNC